MEKSIKKLDNSKEYKKEGKKMPKHKHLTMSMYIDWDKYKNCFCVNLFLKDYKIVVKMPLISQKKPKKDIKIKKFNLTKYIYLTSFCS